MSRFSGLTSAALFVLALPLVGPGPSPYRQSDSRCPAPSDRPAPSITFDPTQNADVIEQLAAGTLGYLNALGSTAGLETALERALPAENPSPRTASVAEADINGDASLDVLVSISVDVGPFSVQRLTLYGCANGAYVPLTSLETPDPNGIAIEAVADLTGDARPEVVIRGGLVQQKRLEAVRVYAWHDQTLEQIWWTDYHLGTFAYVVLDAATQPPDLLVGSTYAYTAPDTLGVSAISLRRPIQTRYDWRGTTFDVLCRSFTDEPSVLYQVLQSAEAYRRCGMLDDALAAYQQMIDDPTLEAWTVGFDVEIPVSVADSAGYLSRLEKRYLTAFAYFRLTQIQLFQGNIDLAGATYRQAQALYARGDHGYRYVAMTGALLQTYDQTASFAAACASAARAFLAAQGTADPGIDYIDDPVHFGFYYEGGIRYAADPDDLFAVPEGLQGMLNTPVCLSP